VDYVEIDCRGEHTLIFTGSTVTGLLPEDAYSGEFAFWSNKGDESNMRLTREFDFSGVSGPIELTFRTWYDLEVDYDYLYLEAAADGQHWQILTTPSGTADDPSGNSYGWGYNGVSDEWIEESVDLSQFAGKRVQLRFEYVTDAAVNGEGFLLDDVSVAAVDYFADFESDAGGWVADGFARVKNELPQTFRLALVRRGGEICRGHRGQRRPNRQDPF
jgi:bacillopeptidase F (M6 metalloprotease family)